MPDGKRSTRFDSQQRKISGWPRRTRRNIAVLAYHFADHNLAFGFLFATVVRIRIGTVLATLNPLFEGLDYDR